MGLEETTKYGSGEEYKPRSLSAPLTQYYFGGQIKKNEMGGAVEYIYIYIYIYIWERRDIYSVLVGKPEGKRPLGRRRRRWKENIKMDLKEMLW